MQLWKTRYVMHIGGGGLLRNFLAFYESVELHAQGAKWRRPPRRCNGSGSGSGLHACPAASIARYRLV